MNTVLGRDHELVPTMQNNSSPFFLNFLNMTPSQWPYYRLWLVVILVAETLMLIYNHQLFTIYLLIALAFTAGFLLRILKIYPGQPEPLILDLSAVLIGLLYAVLSVGLGQSGWRFFLILTSSIILGPHFVFIARTK